MSNTQAAQRYAKTLFLYAKDHNIVEDVVLDMENIASIFKKSPRLKPLLSNPLQSAKVFQTLKDDGLSRIISKWTMTFLDLLYQKNRVNILSDIPAIFLDFYQRYQNFLKVTIKSAPKLTDGQIDKIKRILKKKFPEKEFIIDNLIEPDLIAGFQIQIGDTIIDSNIKSNLEQIKKKLAA